MTRHSLHSSLFGWLAVLNINKISSKINFFSSGVLVVIGRGILAVRWNIVSSIIRAAFCSYSSICEQKVIIFTKTPTFQIFGLHL